MDIETVAMTIIAHSGEARTAAFKALQSAKSGNFEEAEELMKESEKESIEAHNAQTELLVSEANGDKTEVNVLLVHSQDHLMTSILAQELIKEIIYLHKSKSDK